MTKQLIAITGAIVIFFGLVVLGSNSASGQTTNGSMNMTIDIMACAGASEGLGTYEEYSTEQKTYSKEFCDYVMQYYDVQCKTFQLDTEQCARDSYSYIKLQGYLQREGLKNIAYNGIQVIEKTVKVEVEDNDDKHKDRKHHRGGNDPCNYHGLDVCDSKGDCDSERFDCLSDCKDGSSATTGQCPHDDRHRDKDRDNDDRKEHDKDKDAVEEEEQEEEEEPEQEEEEEEPEIKPFD